LLEQRKQDEGYNYEINQAFSELAIQQQAESLDPDNRDCYVCARCKNNVARRIKQSVIVCEKPGCFEIDLRYDGYSVE
jgi:ribosomal protein L37AE/L43A